MVPCRPCIAAPNALVTEANSRSVPTASPGATPKSITRIGVISAPPPMPVSPTTKPTPAPARLYSQPSIIGGPRRPTRGCAASRRALEVPLLLLLLHRAGLVVVDHPAL